MQYRQIFQQLVRRYRETKLLALLSMLLIVSAQSVYASPGDLDPTFGRNGVVISYVSEAPSTGKSVVTQPDGKIVVAGKAQSFDLVVNRFNVDGSTDFNFGYGGRIVIDINNFSDDTVSDMVLQSDGRILVTGFTENSTNRDIFVVRLTGEGTLDTSFGTKGIVVMDTGSYAAAEAMSVQSDGKIIVVGNSAPNNYLDTTLMRYNTDGTLDASFGTGGVAQVNLASPNRSSDIAIQNDGKLVTSGFVFIDGSRYASVMRFNSNGSLDTSFGQNGVASMQSSNAGEFADAITLQNDGKIVIVGDVLARFDSTGSLDRSFGPSGSGIIAEGGNSLIVELNGQITVGKNIAESASTISTDVALTRYTSNGFLDTSFGSSGTAYIDLGGNDSLEDFVLTPNGYLLNGTVAVMNSDFVRQYTGLVHLLANGTVDLNFGNNGKVITAAGTYTDSAADIKLQADNKIVVGGYATDYSMGYENFNLALVRYNENGSLDLTFGINGQVITDISGESEIGRAIAIQEDGKIVMGGVSDATKSGQGLVARYNANGTVDSTFGTNGFVYINPTGSVNVSISSVIILNDGKIVAGGAVSGDFGIFRFNTDGSADSSFGNNGSIITDFGSDVMNGGDSLIHVIQIGNGQLIAFGQTHNGFDIDIAIARYNSDGTLDFAFGSEGKIVTNVSAYDSAGDISVQRDEKLVVVGTTSTGATDAIYMVRYNSDGSLDSSFDNDGFVVTDLGYVNGIYAQSVVVTDSGQILVAGSTITAADSDFMLARFNSNGSIDSTFGTNGVVTSDLSGQHGFAVSMEMQNDGKVLLVGAADKHVAVARFETNTPNQPPVAYGQTLGSDEDTALVITLTASDLDNDPLTFTVTTPPTNGTLSGTAPNLTYTPNANFNGNDSFTFVANDGQADSTAATVNIAVAPVNDATVANAQQITVNEDGSVNITLSGSDIDSASLSFVVISQPQNGTLTGSAPNLVYTPNANFNGNDSLTFKVNDGALDSALALVAIGVTPVNDLPVATNDSAATATGSTVINVLSNDSDIDGDPLSITSVGMPAHGSATSNGSMVTYTPNVGYTGQDSFTYTISDGQGGSATAQVLITVSGSTQAQLTIRLVSNPASTRNVSFSGNGGIGTFILDNPSIDDGDAYLQSKTFTVQPGTYTIAQVTTNAAWYIDSIVCTQPATVSGQSAQIAIQAGQQVECVFTNNQVVAVRARVYNDSDGNGKRTGKDPYVGGWEVRLYDNSGALIGTQLSDSQGRVAFEGLHSGSYSACETLKSGWRSTQPSVLDPNYHQPCYTFVVTPGQVANLLYGNTTLPVGSASIVANMDGIQIEMLPDDESENSFAGKVYLPFVNR